MLERVLGVTGSVKREVPGLIAADLPVLALNGGLERLVSGIRNRDVEREVEVVVVTLVEAGGNGHRLGNRERSGLFKRDATVVAEGDVDRRAIPVGIDDGGSGIRSVLALAGVQFVDIGEPASTLLQNEVSRFVGGDCTRNTLGNVAGEGDHARRLGGRSASDVVPGALVVVRRRTAQRSAGALSALSVDIQGRVFGDVVVAVTRRGSECRRRVSIRPIGVRVREEIDLPIFRVAGDVVRHGLVRICEEANRLFLEARLIEHADGERQRHVASSRILVNVEMTKRNEGRRNGDGHLVASPGIIGALDADDDVFEVTRGIEQVAGRAVERVGIDVSGSGFIRVGEDLLGEHNALEAVDLHVVAQLIGKRHVARRVLGTLDDIGGMTSRTHDVLRDSAKDVLEIVGTRRGLIEVGVGRARTKLVILRCSGIVAGQGV